MELQVLELNEDLSSMAVGYRGIRLVELLRTVAGEALILLHCRFAERSIA